MVAKRSWQRAKSQSPPKPPVPVELQAEVLAQAAVVVAKLQKRLQPPPKDSPLNWCESFFARWRRGSLYFVAVMRTPHGRPPTFETHVARMEYAGEGKFDLAVPMRRGWNTVGRGLATQDCLREIGESAWL